ncbi:helix-turn-helix transcriptional regulator [Desulfolucanica intricata]|uniref:helix-turn-helix transcriptional regulator n=1 Tax=Desulfolucanica intricata TaxID=1285191 RepID=UPI0008368BBC|nr:helix-turn-helix domain-containing protein [Desulfolucanica intricata]
MNEILIQARKERGFTQEQAAAVIGINRSTYAHCERGRIPCLETALKIAQALNKSVEEIFLPANVLNQHTMPTCTERRQYK